jgi:cyanophycin synthetase
MERKVGQGAEKMKILSVRHIDGPNIYIYKPVLVARIDLEALGERESYEFAGFADRLLRLLPGLREHHCAKGEPGGFVERLYGGTYFGHIVEHVTIELACCAGLDVHFGKTVYAGGRGLYDMVMECKAFACQKSLLDAAVDIVDSLLVGQSVALNEIWERAAKQLARTQLGPSTQAIVDAALERNIPVRRLSHGSLVQLGHGCHRKLVEATITENTSAVAVDIACDKELTKSLLGAAGIPVPNGETAETAEEAIEVFRRVGSPVVVKPFNGNQGRGVSLNLSSEEEVLEAYEIATEHSSKVIVERYIEGRNLRILVVEGKYVAASERIPARVCGDGVRTVQQLIDQANRSPLRGFGHEKPLTQIVVDPVVTHTLRKGDLSLEHVPTAGQNVTLRNNANLSTGGEAIDVTDDIHESYRHIAERTARIIGLDVCGIDMVITSIHDPYDHENCSVIEVNAAPGIRMHEHPSYGVSRNVGEDIVNSLYPNGSNGRIPIVAISGTNGKTTTTRLMGHTLGRTGKTVGMTTTVGVWIGDKKVLEGDTTGPVSASMVLSDPTVDVAVLETARGGIVRGGLAYDKANVAVLTNISMDHFGQDGVESIEDLVRVKSLVAECVCEDGTVVLNADDSNLVELSKRLKSRIAFFAISSDNPTLHRHLACGGVGYYISRGWIVEARGNLTWELAHVQEIPLTMDGTAQFQVENCLAASAALRAMGCTRNQVATGLASFVPSRQNRGRCMIYQLPAGAHVILDYGHNPDGFVRMGQWLKQTPHRRLVGVVGVPGDRLDAVVRQSALRAADVFDFLVVKEDKDKRGRREGEIADIMAREIARAAPGKPLITILSETDALRWTLQHVGEGDLVVMFYEDFSLAEQVVEACGGVITDRLVDVTADIAAAAPL